MSEPWMPSDEEIVFARNVTMDLGCAPIRSLIRTTVEKALAEQDQKHSGAVEDLMARFRGLLAEQEARHKRDVIEAKIGAVEAVKGFSEIWPVPYDDGREQAYIVEVDEIVGKVQNAYRAELAALGPA